jgi:hypothetical protein
MRTSVRAERSEPEVIRPEMAGGKQAKPAGDRSPQAINPTPSASPPEAELKHPGGMRAPRSGTDRPKVGPAGVKAGGRNQHSAVRAGDRSPQAINPTPSVPARCSGQQEGCRGPIDSSAGTPTLQLNVAAPSSAPERQADTAFPQRPYFRFAAFRTDSGISRTPPRRMMSR